MGVLEEGGKAVNSFMDAMKAQPLSLALVVMNLSLLAYLFYNDNRVRLDRNRYVVETQQILASCLHVDDIDKLLRARERP